MKVVDALRAIRELLSDESRWIRGAPARNMDGEMVWAASPTACKWCLWGAMSKVAFNEPIFVDTWCAIDGLIGAQAVGDWNDTHTHAEVLAVIDQAIDNCETLV